MRSLIFTLAASALLMAAAPSMAEESATSLLNHNELITVQKQSAPPTDIVVTAEAPTPPVQTAQMPAPITPSWAGYGNRQFGPNYSSYVPMEIKSNNPEIMRTWDASGYPGNGNQQTPEGLSCASDADCVAPLACFDRADSGMVARKLCALPPEH